MDDERWMRREAELLAIDRADLSVTGRRARAVLYVNLEPCLLCLGAAFTAKLGTVVFGPQLPTDGCRSRRGRR